MRTAEQQELAAKVLKQITEHPEEYAQGDWFYAENFYPHFAASDQIVEYVKDAMDGKPVEACGATACVAGWATILYYLDKRCTSERHVEDEARDLLGLSVNESEWLFTASRSFEEVTDALRTLADGEELDVPHRSWEDDL